MDVDWEEVRKKFEKEMAGKLKNLPGHRDVPKNLQEFRNIISHKLPETVPHSIFQELITILLKEKLVDLNAIRRKYLYPQLELEKELLGRHRGVFVNLRGAANKWVKEKLPEAELKRLWKEHKTWLPRRYLIYSKQVSFQKTAANTLARYALINKLFSNFSLR